MRKRKYLTLFLFLFTILCSPFTNVRAAGINYIPDNRLDIIQNSNRRIVLTTKNLTSMQIDDANMYKEWADNIDMYNGDISPGWRIRMKDVNKKTWTGNNVILKFSNVTNIGGRNINATVKVTKISQSKVYTGNDMFYAPISITSTGFLLMANSDTAGIWCTIDLTWADNGQIVNVPLFHGLEDMDGNNRSNGTHNEGYELLDGYQTSNLYVWQSSLVDIANNNTLLQAGINMKPVQGTDSWIKAGALCPTKNGHISFRYQGAGWNGSTLSLYSSFTDFSKPVKAVDASRNYYLGETVTYGITQKIPEFYADILEPLASFTITDTLPEEVTYQSAKVMKGTEEITTSKGTLSYNTGTRTLSYSLKADILADKNFYDGREIKLVITAKTAKDKKGTVVNQAATNIGEISLSSNTVTIGLQHKITTKVTNGTITAGMQGIESGISKTVTYTPSPGYRLASVTVDGTSVNKADYPSSYTFTNIRADHTINVVFEKITYQVAYNGNGNTNPNHLPGEMMQNTVISVSGMPASSYVCDTKGSLRVNDFKREGYVFIGWNTKPDGTGTAYPDKYGNVLNWSETNGTVITLYAQWQKQLGTEIISVRSEETGNLIPGIGMRLYKKVNGIWEPVSDIGTKTTDANGKISLSNLHWFEYEWRMEQVPDGYMKADPITFSINSKNLSAKQEMILYLKKGTLILDSIVSDIWYGENPPAFIYHVSGTDAAGVSHSYDIMVQVGANKTGTSSQSEIPAGNYTVTSVPVARYEADPAQAVLNATVNEKSGTADLLHYDKSEIRFPYHIHKTSGYGSEATKRNVLE